MSDLLNWYTIEDPSEIISPALLVYPGRIEENIKLMLDIADSPSRLRPHIKTYKIAEIIKLQLSHGINKFKCATIPEAKLVADCGASDILLAMQPVGINIDRFIKLIVDYPKSQFSTIVDNHTCINQLAQLAALNHCEINVFLDVNNGMNRTGIEPGDEAVGLCELIISNDHLNFKGIHVYDGHIHDTDFNKRKEVCDTAFESVELIFNQLVDRGFHDMTIVAGGTPTFPIHASRTHLKIELSPGTPLLWDQGYADEFPDLEFSPAAVLMTRVVSKPKEIICFDLGHKSVAAEMPIPRIKFFDTNYYQVGHSEEHLMAMAKNSSNIQVGDVKYALPMHICPTVIRYDKVLTVADNKVIGSWQVLARDH